MIYLFAPLLAAAADPDNSARMLLDGTPVAGCGGFADLEVDLFAFDRYPDYFDENSSFTLYPAGAYVGPVGIQEYVKFASPESPFVESMTALPGGAGYLKGVNDAGDCVFVVMAHRRYELSATYSSGETIHVATMVKVTYAPASHKIASIALTYEAPFVQHFFDSVRTRNSYSYACDTLRSRCPSAGVETWSHNGLASHEECIERFEQLPTFDDGPHLANSPGGGIDGNSASCRLLHSFLATFDTDHCAHVSFLPMADPSGSIKCQSSKRMRETDFFDPTDLFNFDSFKEAAGYPKADGYKVVDKCFYQTLRRPVPRPYWRAWRDAHEDWVLPPLEYLPDDGDDWSFAWLMCYSVWVSVLILGLGSEYIVGHVVTQYLSGDSLKHFWKASQFIFPLFVTIALVSHSYWGLLFLVLGLWKFGSPETIVYFNLARNRHEPPSFRLRCAIEFLGTLLHHSATSLLIVSLTTRREFLDRNVLSCTLPLVIQHWFCLTKYIHKNVFVVSELILEVVWEWELIFNITQYPCHSWNFKLISWTMLVAHWLYLASATMGLLAPVMDTLGSKFSSRLERDTVTNWTDLGSSRLELDIQNLVLVACDEKTDVAEVSSAPRRARRTTAALERRTSVPSAEPSVSKRATQLQGRFLAGVAEEGSSRLEREEDGRS